MVKLSKKVIKGGFFFKSKITKQKLKISEPTAPRYINKNKNVIGLYSGNNRLPTMVKESKADLTKSIGSNLLVQLADEYKLTGQKPAKLMQQHELLSSVPLDILKRHFSQNDLKKTAEQAYKNFLEQSVDIKKLEKQQNNSHIERTLKSFEISKKIKEMFGINEHDIIKNILAKHKEHNKVKEYTALSDPLFMSNISDISGKKNRNELKEKFKEYALKYHPDKPNGSTYKFIKLKQMYDNKLKEINSKGIQLNQNGSIKQESTTNNIGVVKTNRNKFILSKPNNSENRFGWKNNLNVSNVSNA